jgi:hypothetical protein
MQPTLSPWEPHRTIAPLLVRHSALPKKGTGVAHGQRVASVQAEEADAGLPRDGHMSADLNSGNVENQGMGGTRRERAPPMWTDQGL